MDDISMIFPRYSHSYVPLPARNWPREPRHVSRLPCAQSEATALRHHMGTRDDRHWPRDTHCAAGASAGMESLFMTYIYCMYIYICVYIYITVYLIVDLIIYVII